MPTRVGRAFVVSLMLHVLALAALSFALPRLSVKPGVVRRVELAIVSQPLAAEPAAVPASVEVETMVAEPARPVVTRPRRTVASKPRPQPTAAVQVAQDGSALERVLRKIAGTTELTQDERRRAMMLVLRTWEDPSGERSAEELVDALIREVRRR